MKMTPKYLSALAMCSWLGAAACSGSSEEEPSPSAGGSGGQAAAGSGASGGSLAGSSGTGSSNVGVDGGAGSGAATGSGGRAGSAGGGGSDAGDASGGSASGGVAGSSGGTAGSAGLGGTGGAGGGGGGLGGTSGSSTGGATQGGAAGSSDGLSAKDFVCNQIQGVSAVNAWFGGGFEQEPGIDGARWQAISTHAAYVEKWTDPNNEVWDLPIQTPCANGSKSPDRIIFNPVNWKYVTQAEWETAIQKVVVTLKAKYPAVKRIELITMIRAPGNKQCTQGGVSSEQTVAPALDAAIEAVAAADPRVTVGPLLFAPNCSVFSGTTANFNSSSYGAVAKAVAAAFAAEP